MWQNVLIHSKQNDPRTFRIYKNVVYCFARAVHFIHGPTCVLGALAEHPIAGEDDVLDGRRRVACSASST